MLAALLPGLLACPFSFPNEQHCTRQGGDSYCAGLDDTGNYCAVDGCGAYDETANVTGCVDAPPTDTDCYRPCGDVGNCVLETGSSSSSSTGDPTGSTSLPSTSSTSSTTEEPPTTTEALGCEGCEEARQLCVDDVCVPCGSDDHDVLCRDQHFELRHCVDGACQQCIYGDLLPFEKGGSTAEFDRDCSPEFPSCNIDAGVCFYCESDDECASGGCFGTLLSTASGSFPTGYCMPPDLVFHVSAARGSLSGDGTEDNPFANLAQAFAIMNTESPAGLVHLDGGEYTQPLGLPERHYVMVRGNPADRPVIRGAELATGLNGHLALDNLVITGNTGPGVQADGGVLRLRGVEIVGNAGPAIAGTRVIIDSANSILAGNGGGALEITTSIAGALVSTTMTNGELDTATPVITCGEFAGGVTVQRCLYAGSSTQAFDCPDTMALGTALISDLSGIFVDAPGLDFHVTAGASGLAPLGPSQDHFPSNDIDGDSRSQDDRVGADVP